MPATPETPHRAQPSPRQLVERLQALQHELESCVSHPGMELASVHPEFMPSARNLLQYLALRRQDLRPLQADLAELGLSSLGRSESHVLATVNTVLATLRKLAELPAAADQAASSVDFAAGARLLGEHSERLLGRAPAGGGGHIMVTMPAEAADDPGLVAALLRSGMTCARINCAHDGPQVWSRIIARVRRAERELGLPCKISMDLAGPKLRTGPMPVGPAVTRLRPARDALGKVLRPATLWLGAGGAGPAPAADVCATAEPAWLARLASGDKITLRDTRGAKRKLTVSECTAAGCLLTSRKTVYLGADTRLRHRNRNGEVAATALGGITGREIALLLHPGDRLLVTADEVPARAAEVGGDGQVLAPAMVSCTLPEIIPQVKVGEEIWFDDGRIGGVVEQASPRSLSVRITSALAAGSKLRADKGINLPGSELRLAAMTARDREDLAFVARHADIVALSFANSVADVSGLIGELHRHGNRQAGIVLKIETLAGFRNLPAMLCRAMSMPACGVMIARGDLAVEMGFARLAEVQEEILWLCEAAHVPVIWATQVLENLAKHGAPTRAEITDAAMGRRAECVMLNKGPYIVKAVQTLDDILRRMQGHQVKKVTMLRELHVAGL